MKPARKLHPEDRALLASGLEAIDQLLELTPPLTGERRSQRRQIAATREAISQRLAETAPNLGHTWEAQAEYRGPARGRTRPGDKRRVTATAQDFDQAFVALTDAARGWVVLRETVREVRR